MTLAAPTPRQLFALGLVAAVGFAATLAAEHSGVVTDFDETVIRIATKQVVAVPGRASVVLAVTELGAAWCLTAVSLAAVLIWLLRRDYRWALGGVLVFAGAGLSVTLMKATMARERPVVEAPAAVEMTPSLPSGHASGAMTIYGMIGHYLAGRARGWRRAGWAVLTGVLVGAVGLSRIALAVHYPTDVLAGFLHGAAWLGFGLAWVESGK